MNNCRFHPDKKHYGKGLCRTCWERENKWKNRGINITTEGYFALLSKQGGTCAFCDRKPREHRLMDVDHNHKNGKVRGLLCNEHNRAIGILEKNAELLEAMLKYIKFDGLADEA